MMGVHRSSDYGSPGLPSPAESKQRTPRRPVVKKPLNAFMLFMKEMRQKVIDECTLKESAAINQILGRKVHPRDTDSTVGTVRGKVHPRDTDSTVGTVCGKVHP